MSDKDSSESEATQDLESSAEAADPSDLDRVVSYGRLVNVLAATADRLSQNGYTVTETQTRVILKVMRDREGGDVAPEEASYRLDTLAETASEVVGINRKYLKATVHQVVEPDRPR